MKRNDYVVCPCCGRTKLVRLSADGRLEWIDYDPRTMEFIQVREGGGKTLGGRKGRGQGRGIGFPKVASHTLEDAVLAGGDNLAVAKQIAARLNGVVKEFKRLGLMS